MASTPGRVERLVEGIVINLASVGLLYLLGAAAGLVDISRTGVQIAMVILGYALLFSCIPVALREEPEAPRGSSKGRQDIALTAVAIGAFTAVAGVGWASVERFGWILTLVGFTAMCLIGAVGDKITEVRDRRRGRT